VDYLLSDARIARKAINVPNLLTVFRLLLVMPMAIYLLEGRLLPAGVLFALAAVTDFADGWIARRFNAITTFGRLLDPVADKLLIGTAVALLWWKDFLPSWFAAVVFAREAFVLLAAGYARGRGEEVEALRPHLIGKAGAAAQMLLVGIILLPLPAVLKSPQVQFALMLAATLFTLTSAGRYVLRWLSRKAPAH
jgi:CDP-diacylglycerol--glycerol-3-phosphate 3-phosphatidyltransferase